jgi:hypothetical protein
VIYYGEVRSGEKKWRGKSWAKLFPPANISNSARLQKDFFFWPSYSSLLICFFITFSFPSTLAPHHESLALYTTTMNDASKRKSFSVSYHLSYKLSLTSSIITLFFLADSTGRQRIQVLWRKF